MEKFSVSVNIAPNSNVTFILTYEEMLQRRHGQYEILTRVKPKQLVHNFEVQQAILVLCYTQMQKRFLCLWFAGSFQVII